MGHDKGEVSEEFGGNCGGHSVQRGGVVLVSNSLPKGQWRRVKRGRDKAPPSHLLPLPPPQLAPSFVQSHTKDKGPRPAWPSAPSRLRALKETAPPPCRLGAAGRAGAAAPQDLISVEPQIPPAFPPAPPASRSGIILPPPQAQAAEVPRGPEPGGVGGEGRRGSRGTSPSSPPALRRRRGRQSSVARP